MKLLPDSNAQETDDPQDSAQYKTRQHLAAGNPPPVPEADLPQRHGPDDNGRGLAAGITATGYDQRDEQRQHNGLADLILEMTHSRSRQHFPQKQYDQPARTFLHQAEKGNSRVRFIQRFGTPDLLYFPRSFRFRQS